ncbi:MAG: trypsin-like peptidase domain-containing protein, partial [Planctomycetes bacterium]|nr:trypsin-like peptidase domain-containing protein [Planctomycetota bacterium]
AHVVEVAVLDLSVHGFPHVEVVTDYRVTFVEGVNSHSARVLRRPSGADAPDLAVLGIEPFPGMPFVQGFRSDVTPAADGDRVMMLGFPYRTFRVYEGVVTRWRSPDGHDYLMFDRPVHPGASGSPLVDPTGAIVGIAKGRLENPDTGEPIESGGISIPIGDVRSVWP